MEIRRSVIARPCLSIRLCMAAMRRSRQPNEQLHGKRAGNDAGGRRFLSKRFSRSGEARAFPLAPSAAIPAAPPPDPGYARRTRRSETGLQYSPTLPALPGMQNKFASGADVGRRSGPWLRIRFSGGRPVCGNSAPFACDDFADPARRRKDLLLILFRGLFRCRGGGWAAAFLVQENQRGPRNVLFR